jgi:hypothetical protein
MLDTYGTISEAVKAAHDKRRADLEAEQRRHLEAAQRLAERGDSLIRDLDAANPPDGGPYRSPGNARAVVQGIRARFPRRPATGGTTGPQERPPQRTTTSSRTKGNGDPKAPARRPTRKGSDDPESPHDQRLHERGFDDDRDERRKRRRRHAVERRRREKK